MFREIKQLRPLDPDVSLLFHAPALKGDSGLCIVRTGVQRFENEIQEYTVAVLSALKIQEDVDSLIASLDLIDYEVTLLCKLSAAAKEFVDFIEVYNAPDKVKLSMVSVAEAISVIFETPSDLKIYEIVIPLIGEKGFLKCLQTQSSIEVLNTNEKLKKLSVETVESIAEKLNSVVAIIVNTEVEKAKSAPDIEDPLNVKFQRKLADKLECNIYTVDSILRRPVCSSNTTFAKSVVVLKMGEKYEMLGELLEGNEILREFPPDHEFIATLNKYLDD